MTPSSEALSLSVSPEPVLGRHVVRWVEQRPWGASTLLITTCTPGDLSREREAFALFCQLPAERRALAVAAVRHSNLPAVQVLKGFLPPVQEQPTLF